MTNPSPLPERTKQEDQLKDSHEDSSPLPQASLAGIGMEGREPDYKLSTPSDHFNRWNLNHRCGGSSGGSRETLGGSGPELQIWRSQCTI